MIDIIEILLTTFVSVFCSCPFFLVCFCLSFFSAFLSSNWAFYIPGKPKASFCFLPLFFPPLSSRTEKAMAPHSSTRAWRIPWMEEPGRLQSVGSLRVGHNWATSLSLSTFLHWRRKKATHSSVLAWRIPGTEEPYGLPSTGLHRVGHDWSDLAVAAAAVGLTGEGNGTPLHYSCLENPMDGGAW